MQNKFLLVKNLQKKFINREIFEKKFEKNLWDIPYLEINEPGLYILGGKNGVGKSTFLRILIGLISADAGEILWFGKKKLSSQMIGYLPEFPIISPALKTINWLEWLLSTKQKNLEYIDNFLSKYENLSIKHLFNIPANRLSKGQKQKIQLWAALSQNPQGLILDEPFSGLDPWAKTELSSLIIKLIQEGLYIILSTHELSMNLREKTKQTWIIDKEKLNIYENYALPL